MQDSLDQVATTGGSPLGTAVVGCGMISEIYLANMVRKFSILNVIGCCDLDISKATQRAKQFGIKAMTLEEITRDPSVELVVNLTTPKAHAPIIRRLLEAGKHVYTEKTMTVELADAAALVALANQKHQYLGVAPDTFLGSAIQTARQAIDQGMIGAITSCTAQVLRDRRLLGECFAFTNERGGGIAFDVGIYYITALAYLMGPVKRVTGFTRQALTEDVYRFPRDPRFGETYPVASETLMAGALEFCSGALGTVQFSSESVFPEHPLLMICGTEGVLTVEDPNCFGGAVHLYAKGAQEPFTLPCVFGFTEDTRGLGVAEMAWAIRANRPCRANPEMAYHNLEVLHGLTTSGHNGEATPILSGFSPVAPLPAGYLGEAYFGSDPETALV